MTNTSDNTDDRQSVVIPIVADADCWYHQQDQNNDDGSKTTPTIKEWTILDLNGELIIPVDMTTATPQNENNDTTSPVKVLGGPNRVELGSVQYHDEETMKLILGSHEMKGSIEQLKQPFCVFEKQRVAGASAAEGGTGGSEKSHHPNNNNNNIDDDDDDKTSTSLQYKVVGIVKTKVLFNNYPKTIMRPSY